MIIVTAHFRDGTDKSRRIHADEGYEWVRGLIFKLASSVEIVSVSITKDDLLTRVMDGRLKL